jgi:GT2 family glycosyltransferase
VSEEYVQRMMTSDTHRDTLDLAEAEVLLITVNYGTAADVRRLLDQPAFHPAPAQGVSVVVVDNGPKRGEGLASINRSDGRVRLLVPGRNLGYFGAAHWALRQYSRDRALPRWIAVCNPDITLKTPDFFVRLLELYGSDQPTVLAPAILSMRTGEAEPIFMLHRPARSRMHFYKWIFRYYPLGCAYHVASAAKSGLTARRGRGRRRRPQSGTPTTIYAPHGSFLLFNRSYFERGGSLAYGAFLFGEEFFVAESVRRLDGSIVYDPRLEVLHRGGTTTRYLGNRAIARHLADASRYVADEFFP